MNRRPPVASLATIGGRIRARVRTGPTVGGAES
jgi:hypothetical protein